MSTDSNGSSISSSSSTSNGYIKPEKNDGPQTKLEVSYTKFIREPILEKDINLLPGIDDDSIDKLCTKGFSKIYCLLGLYLCVNEEEFKDFLKQETELDYGESDYIYNGFKQWCDLHL